MAKKTTINTCVFGIISVILSPIKKKQNAEDYFT